MSFWFPLSQGKRVALDSLALLSINRAFGVPLSVPRRETRRTPTTSSGRVFENAPPQIIHTIHFAQAQKQHTVLAKGGSEPQTKNQITSKYLAKQLFA